MIINHNLMAINANRNMNINNNKAASSMKKLSSGLRINSAADDAAGLAISEKMIGQVGGLNQASSNSQDGISLIETAEGALNETTSILQRMRDLAVQSSNDSNTDQDRKNIQLEMGQLEDEVDTIGNTIQFNTKNLLDGSMGKAVTSAVANVSTSATMNTNGDIKYYTSNSSLVTSAGTYKNAAGDYTTKGGAALYKTAAGSYRLSATGSFINASGARIGDVNCGTATTTGVGGTVDASKTKINWMSTTEALTDLRDSNGNSLKIASTDVITVSYIKGDGKFMSFTLSGSKKVGDIATSSNGDFAIAAVTTGISSGLLKITAASTGTANAIEGVYIQVKDSNGAVKTPATEALSSFAETTEAQNKRNDGTQTLQIGANVGQNLKVDIGDMRSEALGISGLDVSTQAHANVAIKVIDNATQKVSAERAKLGAFDNRLQHTINNLGTSSENLTSAEARIKDVDMASEMAEYSKENVLTQAAQAMLAQANQQPQQVLQLLR